MGHSRGVPQKSGIKAAGCVLAALLAAFPAWAEDASPTEWETIHSEMREALAALSAEYAGSPGVSVPVVLVDFTATDDPRQWRRAAAGVVKSAAAASGLRQPLVVVSGHGAAGAAVGKVAGELARHGLEVSLAVYVDAFPWGRPLVPENVRYAVSFHQRAGILNGLPVRGKPRLAPVRPDRTVLLGSYEITPRGGRRGWSWNLLRPLFGRQHHRMAHDARIRNYLREAAGFRLARAERAPAAGSRGLFDRVVIVGASVSANQRAPSPGLLLARHMSVPETRIFTFAEGGAPSARHLGFLDNIARLRPSLIVALDLFYHDFKASLFLSASRKRYLRDYVARLHATGAVVVLGNLPGLVLLRHEHVNHYLDELAAEFPNLVLLDVRHLIEGLEPAGMLVRDGGRELTLGKQDLFADRVHPNLLGSTLVANHILERLAQRYPGRLDRRGPLPLPLENAPLNGRP